MDLVRVLPDRVANQIAAGEVIERPASIVKELVENSLDAGATRLEVEFNKGGRTLIRVEDNGPGMSRGDALLSIERHATSKIREASDLDRVVSFGFRGEALPSIASVCRFVLQTRMEGDEAGTEIVINGGKLLHVRDCGMPVGTRIVITQLFNSVPARRKFLKSDRTEAGHIIQAVRLYALASPSVAFTLIEDRRQVFQSPVCPALVDRVTEIFGRQIADQVRPVSGTQDDLRIEGLLGRPGTGRSTRHEMITFVNGRPVENRTLAYAILESYHTLIPKGRYPVAFLFLSIDPAGVDVNVHPSKREVRFRDEPRVRGFTIRTILECLRNDSEERNRRNRESREVVPPAPPFGPASSRPSANVAPDSHQWSERGPPPDSPPDSPTKPAVKAWRTDRGQSASSDPEVRLPGREESAEAAAQVKGSNLGWKFLGVFQGTTCLFETDQGLILLDRRAAEQRIWYERLLNDFRSGEVAAQRLLFAVPLELDPIGGAILADHLGFFGSHGFDIALFGRNFFRIEGVPVWLETEEVEVFVRDLVGLIRQGRLSTRKPDLAGEVLAKAAALRLAGKSPIPDGETIGALVDGLFSCEIPQSSPTGRPTYIELDSSELNRRFHRGRANSKDEFF
jgi:DNA mismatch repair protein MutL